MTDAWTGEMRKGVAEMCVLFVLNRKEAYGYEIAQALGERPSLAMKESTLYLILARLEKDGAIVGRLAPSPKGPKRRYFALTSAGRGRLADQTAFWRGFAADVDALMEDHYGE